MTRKERLYWGAAMLVIFTIPRHFEGETGRRQHNAVRSWRASNPDARIVLFGDEDMEDAAKTDGAVAEPVTARSNWGTPILRNVFDDVRRKYPAEAYVYMNADIILLEDIGCFLRDVPLAAYLGVARRTNLDVDTELSFEDARWRDALRARLRTEGQLDSPLAMDWFLMKGDGPWVEPPAFIVGRPAWDNWMVFAARARGLPVVDFSDALEVVHQNHDYAHVPERSGARWSGPEAAVNRRLAWEAGAHHRRGQVYSIAHATHGYDGRRLRRRIGIERWREQWRVAAMTFPRLAGFIYAIQDLQGLIRGRDRKAPP